VHFKTPQTQAATYGYFLVILILRNERWELMFLFSHLHFIELILEFSIILGYKTKHRD